MSGGSYNYLCRHTEDLCRWRGTIEEMAERLEGLPYASAAAVATRRVLALLTEAEAQAFQLREVWHAVEWWDSSDYTEADARVPIRAFAALPPDPTIAERISERLRVHADLPSPTERRRLRKLAGLSQAELGRVVGVTPQAVSQWESGTCDPRGPLLDRYVEALRKFRTLEAEPTTGATTHA